MKCGKVIPALAACAIIFSLSVPGVAAQETKKAPEDEKVAEKIPEDMGETILVRVVTNLGEFTMELYKDKAPITVENFLRYADAKFYDGTTFHRVIPDFMIQGGGFTATMVKKETGQPIKNEAKNGLKNLEYTVAMARLSDPDVDSATSQFFINTKDNHSLNHGMRNYGHAVFGKVIDGTDVIDKIEKVKTTMKGNYEDVPQKPVVINSIRRVVTEEETEE
jgi:peptidyl-prolyl cis-trans isomerase A (cyclophilin A)